MSPELPPWADAALTAMIAWIFRGVVPKLPVEKLPRVPWWWFSVGRRKRPKR